jgi:hypothetical protein
MLSIPKTQVRPTVDVGVAEMVADGNRFHLREDITDTVRNRAREPFKVIGLYRLAPRSQVFPIAALGMWVPPSFPFSAFAWMTGGRCETEEGAVPTVIPAQAGIHTACERRGRARSSFVGRLRRASLGSGTRTGPLLSQG